METNRWTDGITAELPKAEKLAEDGRKLALKAVASRTPIDQIPLGRKDESAEDREVVRNVARQEVARIANFIIVENAETEVEAGGPQAVTVEQGATSERVLAPKQVERVLRVLQSRFNLNTYLHEGINWKDVEASLKASPEALWSLAQMESAGHAPDVYHDDKDNYYFGTCSLEAPKSARDCVYDKKAANKLRIIYPDAIFNGNAVEMAKAMGIRLMPRGHYRNILQKKGSSRFDKKMASWLLTPSKIKSTGNAFFGYSDDYNVSVPQDDVCFHCDKRAWRGSLKVKKIAA